MKRLTIFLITIGLLLSCSNSKDKQYNGEIPEENITLQSDNAQYNLGEVNKDLIVEIMEVYQEVDNDKVLDILNTQDELIKDKSPAERQAVGYRYINNIYHVDSVSKKVISLTNQERFEDIANLLDSELGNFYAHPNSDSYTVYQLHWVMLPLYKLISPDEEYYYGKLINMWEMNRILIEGVQDITGQAHPYYERTMFELSSLYDKTGMKEKKAEVDSILADIDPEE